MHPDTLNYWKKDQNDEGSDKESDITEMYVPEKEKEEPIQPKPERPMRQKTDDDPVQWSATEYIHQEKNALWFVIFAIVVLLLIVADIFLIKAYTFSVLVVVMAVSIVVYSRRPPRIVNYTLSGDQGLYIGEVLHHFSEFKAFGMIKDDNHYSIMLIPTKRFAPGVLVYFPSEAGEEIIDILGARLPMKPLKFDMIDILIRKLRL